jgi:tetrahydromethanopterin S-methyltransferase subunit H
MFKFDKEQKEFEIAGVKVGGQPGELPMALIGSIFYEGHEIVRDSKKGVFNEDKAEALINKQEEMSEKTGNPHIVDVVGSTYEALIRYIDFVSRVTRSPFLVDSPSSTVRLKAIEHCMEVGLGERAIYNSIDENVKPEELEALKELGVKAAVVLAFDSSDPRPEGRIGVLKGLKGRKSLLEAAEMAGVKKVLVDTAVLDAPSIGISARTVYAVKSEFGLPAGCAPSNALTTWKALRKMGPYAISTCIAASHAFLSVLGADFALYGPIKYAETVFPACAMVDAFVAYEGRWRGIKPERSHPLYRIFSDNS